MSDGVRHIDDEIEAAAQMVGPVPIDVLAVVLAADPATVVEAVERLEAEGRAESSRLGVTAHESRLSPSRHVHLARLVAEELERRSDHPGRVAAARWAAGEAEAAHRLFVVALRDSRTTAAERETLLDRAIASGTEARVPKDQLAELLVGRARLHRNRGESALAVADIDQAVPLLSREPLVDALGFAAAIHDDLQHPTDAERTIGMAMLVAASEGLDAKLGSLSTFHGRVLSRLGFDAESDHAFTRGLQLIERHGTDVQRYFATANQAWADLDRGWVARAETRYSIVRARAAEIEDRAAAADKDIALARARFATGDGTGAMEALAAAREVADETGAPVLTFLATLAEAEGAIVFHQPDSAVDAAERLRAIVAERFPAWVNRAAAVEARALLLAGRRDDAAAAVRRGLEATPPGANGLRLRAELEALALAAADRWDGVAASDVADRLLQGGWLLPAIGLLTERARRERTPELGRAAAALAHRVGAPLAAADAVEAAKAWNEPVAGPIALAVRRVSRSVPPEWEESWRTIPAVANALAVEAAEDVAAEADLARHLDETLTAAGLGGTDMVLSPAQRRAAGLVVPGRRAASTARFVGLVAAAAVVAAVVAVALRPAPVEIPVAQPAAPTTSTTPPLEQRIVELPDELSGQGPFAGGDSRNAVYEVSLGDPRGVYWRAELTGFVRSDPVLRGRNIYVGTSEGILYGLDTNAASSVFESHLDGPLGVSPAVEQVAFQQDAQGKVLVFAGDETGTLLVRNVNDTEGEVFRLPLGSPITGPPLVRSTSLIVATADGVIHDLLPSDGTEQRRFPAAGVEEGGFVGPLAAADGFIYAVTGTGAVVVIDEASFEEVCREDSGAARATTHPVVADGRWYVGTSSRTIRSFGAGGCSPAGIGSYQIDTPVNFAPVVVDGVLYAVADAVLLPLDVESGQGVGFVMSVGGAFTSPPVVAGDLILVATEGGDLVAFRIGDGSEAWRFPIGSALRTRPVVANGLVLVATARGELIAIAAPAE